ncbi:MAG TPA: nucleotide exchange factor GrpE [Candidatus Tyrphobacter sp.]|nr:nucleotide exchange factor GrpE [Candidatus Tyrphobacter sp.]
MNPKDTGSTHRAEPVFIRLENSSAGVYSRGLFRYIFRSFMEENSEKENQPLNQSAQADSESRKEPELLEGVDEAKDLTAQIEKLTREKDEYLDGWRRAKADLANYKKGEFGRFEEIAKFGSEELMRELISVLDSFDLGVAALEKAGPVEKGVYMIRGQLEDVLRRHGLEKIKVEKGEKFNPAYHEAVGEAEGGQSETIAEEIEKGYALAGRVVRPARVRIYR